MIVQATGRGWVRLGRLGENEYSVILFPCQSVYAEYPDAAVTVLHQRPGDPAAYPVSSQYVQVIDGQVYWTVTSADLSKQGKGSAELIFTSGGVIAKSMIYSTEIGPALDGAGDPPEPWESWVQEVSDEADRAEDAALDAKAWATGKDADGHDLPDTDPHFHNNAYYFMLLCLAATGHYPKVENGYWYIWDVQSEQWSSTGVKATGADGEDGADGYSPTVTITSITGGHKITVTDADGDHSFDVMDGTTPTIPVTDVQMNSVSVLQDGVANVPAATPGAYGVVRPTSTYGVNIVGNSYLGLVQATDAQLKGGSGYVSIFPSLQHKSTFYGLAKAAGDTTQSSSSNSVGTYTDAAKSAISQMLNAPVAVSGSTPSITALAGLQYICGEVSTLDITLPASGIVDVIFESGSTATVLTITPPTGQTVKWANGFDPTSLDANTTYELNIKDGLGVAGKWT